MPRERTGTSAEKGAKPARAGRRAAAGRSRAPSARDEAPAPSGPPERVPWLRFADIAGQRETIWRLQSALAAGRLHHSLLLDGPAGSGKTSIAVALAAALACRRRPPAAVPPPPLAEVLGAPASPAWPLEACGECPSCRKFPEHPDLVRIGVEAEKTRIVIEQVRNAIQEMAFSPHESSHRVVVVRDADRMTDEAANALLKSLEEPAPGNLVVLTSARAAHLLPTIRSRCLRIPVRPLAPGVVRQLLAARSPGVPEAALDFAAGLSAGGVTRAAELLSADVGELFAGAAAFGRAVGGGDLGAIVAVAEEVGADRERTAAFLDLLLALLRDHLVVSCGGSSMLGTASSAAREAFAAHGADAAAVECACVAEARRDLEVNANATMLLEWLGVAGARAVGRARRGWAADA